MTFKETMAKLFSTSEGTYYKWKKEERPIIKLLDKYFDKTDLEEFLVTGNIKKMDEVNLIDKDRKALVQAINDLSLFQKTLLLKIITKYKKQTLHKDINDFILDYGLENLYGYEGMDINDPLNGSQGMLLSTTIFIEGKKTLKMIENLTSLNLDILISEYETLLQIKDTSFYTPRDITSLLALSNGEK